MNLDHEIAKYADRFRDAGYDVQILPAPGKIPELPGVEGAHLFAAKNGERVVVQVKASLAELRQDANSYRLADAVNGKPGWRYDLVVLGKTPPSEDVAGEASEPPAADILQSIARAEHLAKTGDVSVGCLAAWASLEAAMRYAAREAGVDVQSNAATYLVRTLYSHGLLDRADFDRLSDALRIRNTIAHGLAIPAVDPAVPCYLAKLGRHLVSSGGKSGQDAA